MSAEPTGLAEAHAALPALLAAAVAELGLAISASQSTQLLSFVALLERWNRTYNLTAIRDPVGMMTHHVVDCLAAVSPLRRECMAKPAPRVLDVGSGGGLPGVVFAVMLPRIRVTCVDSVGKKAAFVQQAAAALRLGNLQAMHARVESLADERYGVISSRAFASLASFVGATRHVLAEGGVWLAMKGKRPDTEIAELPPTIDVFHVEPIEVPVLDAERCIVWMREAGGSSAEQRSSDLS